MSPESKRPGFGRTLNMEEKYVTEQLYECHLEGGWVDVWATDEKHAEDLALKFIPGVWIGPVTVTLKSVTRTRRVV
jgi:hypothetical protein